ncbi:hypothetical protein [Jatrophihabitans fulvus]
MSTTDSGAPAPRPRPRPAGGAHRAGDDTDDIHDTDETVDRGTDDRTDGGTDDGRPARRDDRRRLRLGLLAAAALLVVAIGVLVTIVIVQRAGDGDAPSGAEVAEVRNPQGAAQFVRDGAKAVDAISTYDYRNLPAALLRGLAVTTGDYRDSFRTAITGTLARNARSGKLTQTFTVVRAGLGAVSDDGTTAKVLVFGTETLKSAKSGNTRTTPSTVTATVVRQNGVVRIAELALGANAGVPPGTPGLAAAAEAARSQLVAMLSYRRAQFDQDSSRALAGAVDPLRRSIAARTAATRAELTTGKYDLSGRVTAIALQQALGRSAVFLVAASGSRVSDSGKRTDDGDSRVAVTVVMTADGWRASQVTPVDGS